MENRVSYRCPKCGEYYPSMMVADRCCERRHMTEKILFGQRECCLTWMGEPHIDTCRKHNANYGGYHDVEEAMLAAALHDEEKRIEAQRIASQAEKEASLPNIQGLCDQPKFVRKKDLLSFTKMCANYMERERELLGIKAADYATKQNRMANFDRVGMMENREPEESRVQP